MDICCYNKSTYLCDPNLYHDINPQKFSHVYFQVVPVPFPPTVLISFIIGFPCTSHIKYHYSLVASKFPLYLWLSAVWLHYPFVFAILLLPTSPQGSAQFFSNLIFSVFRIVSYWVILKFTDDFPSHFYFDDKPIWVILILAIFSALEFPFSSISLLRFHRFLYIIGFFFKKIKNFSENQYNNCFKIWDHSNIWIISWLMSGEFLFFWDWFTLC